MAGTLGRVELLEPAPIEEGRRFAVTNDAILAVQRMGVPDPVAPYGYTGELPPDITSLDDDDLGDLLSKLSQWCSYLNYKLAVADSEATSAKATLEFIRARVRIALRTDDGTKLTVGDKKDMMDTDPRVVEAWSRQIYCQSIYDLVKAMRDRAQMSWETVSRRITQRGQEIERMKRDGSVAGVPSQSRTFHRRTT